MKRTPASPWRRRIRVGGHWWAERPDGSWYWWSWHKGDWEPREGPPGGVRALPPDSSPRFHPTPDPAAMVQKEVRAALVSWLFLFLFWGLIGGVVTYLGVLMLSFFLTIGLWGIDSPSPFVPIVFWEALWAGLCMIGAVIQVALIRRSARVRAEREARGEPEPKSVFQQELGLGSGIAAGVGMVAAFVGAALLLAWLLGLLMRALLN